MSDEAWETDVIAEYAFRISGRVPPALRPRWSHSRASQTSADTLLVGPVADRAALHGFIARIEALGLELVELRRLPAGDEAAVIAVCLWPCRSRHAARDRGGGAVALIEPGSVAEHRGGHDTQQRRARRARP